MRFNLKQKVRAENDTLPIYISKKIETIGRIGKACQELLTSLENQLQRLTTKISCQIVYLCAELILCILMHIQYLAKQPTIYLAKIISPKIFLWSVIIISGIVTEDNAMLQLDFKNVFNSIDRKAIRRGIVAYAPQLCQYFDWTYGDVTDLIIGRFQRGQCFLWGQQ